MKKIILLNLTLLVGLVLVTGSCRKKTIAVAPEPDTEFQSAVDASYAAIVITDVEMICSFLGETDLFPKFYTAAPGYAPVVPSVTPNGDYVFISFNNTKCLDGRVRDGSIAMYTGFINPNAKYYYNYEFQGKVSLLNYKVDKWSVELNNKLVITNKLTSSVFDPAKTNLSWSLNGDFVLTHPSDPTKNMHCNIDLVKTLANTADKNVYNASKLASITWSLATVKYTGTMFGETSGNVPFKFTINDASPLVRDFTCFPDKVSGVNVASAASQIEEFHPFKDGRVNFVTNGLYPRDLSFGNEQSVYHDVKSDPIDLAPQCDNKGIITIKGISYPIDFAKEYK